MPRDRSRSKGRLSSDTIAEQVEALLQREQGLEDHAIQLLRSKPAAVQQLVLSRGGFQGSRNPTAVLVTRIRNAEDGLKPVLESQKANEEVERFLIIERGIEPHAAKKLRTSSKAVQDVIMGRGTLQGTRDPTAVLMTRIREAERDHPNSEPAGIGGLTVDGLAGVAGQNQEEYAAAAYYQYLLQVQAYQTALIEQQALAGAISDPDLFAASQPEEKLNKADVMQMIAQQSGGGAASSKQDQGYMPVMKNYPDTPPQWSDVGATVLFSSNFTGKVQPLSLNAVKPVGVLKSQGESSPFGHGVAAG